MNFTRLLETDAAWSQRLRVAETPGLPRSLAVLFGHTGDSWFWLAGLTLLWWRGNDYWKLRALVFIGAILVTALIVMVLKFSIRRQRPEGEWGQIYRRSDPHSFPSGHAARALMLGVVALGLGPGWLGAVLLAWAFLVGLARVAMGLHYLSDIVVGWGIGIIMGLVVLQSYSSFL